jgi:four helix bundle protein
MTFKRFEDIDAWKLARELCQLVKRLIQCEAFAKDWGLRNQIRDSSGSVMDNIAEGHGRGNNPEFKYFLGVANGSCAETRSQGYRALDYGYISQAEFDQLKSLSLRTSGAITGLIEYLNKTDIKGPRNYLPDFKNPKGQVPPEPPTT